MPICPANTADCSAETSVAAVLRDLSMLRQGKQLSFGERRMYDKAHGLIVQEISAARDVSVLARR